MTMLVHEATRDRANRRADATAVAMGNDRLSYASWNYSRTASRTDCWSSDAASGDRVCLFVPKSPSAVTAMLGSLKAGCVYVPIDLSSPAPRLAKIVAAADPSVVALTEPAAPPLDEVLGALDGLRGVKVAALDSVAGGDHFGVSLAAADLAAQPEETPAARVSPDDAAHILFTSGSTGTPKGVVISHRNVASFLEWAIGYFDIDETDRLSGHAPSHFDLSTFDVYGALTAGSELHLVPPELSLMPARPRCTDRSRATHAMVLGPVGPQLHGELRCGPAWRLPKSAPSVWCGDVLPTPVLIHWMERVRHAQYTNLYGPTEATIASSHYKVSAPPEDETSPIPIGEACAGELLVLDDDLRPVPPDATGDLYIGGSGLSCGYWRDDAKTAAALSPILAHRTVAGACTARVTVRGSTATGWSTSWGGRIRRSRVAVIASRSRRRPTRSSPFARRRWLGCRPATSKARPSVVPLRRTTRWQRRRRPSGRRSRKVLPSYMVPTRWLVLPALPTNANGKIDRRRLRELFLEAHVPRVARDGPALQRGDS